MWSRVVRLHLEVAQRWESVGSRSGSGEKGQSMVEYAIIAALIAIIAMSAVQALGGGIAQVFTNILGRIQGIGA